MKEQDMTQRYRKFQRSWGMWYAFDTVTGNSVSLKTKDSPQFSLRDVGDDWIVFVHELTPQGGSPWKETKIPSALAGLHFDKVRAR